MLMGNPPQVSAGSPGTRTLVSCLEIAVQEHSDSGWQPRATGDRGITRSGSCASERVSWGFFARHLCQAHRQASKQKDEPGQVSPNVHDESAVLVGHSVSHTAQLCGLEAAYSKMDFSEQFPSVRKVMSPFN